MNLFDWRNSIQLMNSANAAWIENETNFGKWRAINDFTEWMQPPFVEFVGLNWIQIDWMSSIKLHSNKLQQQINKLSGLLSSLYLFLVNFQSVSSNCGINQFNLASLFESILIQQTEDIQFLIKFEFRSQFEWLPQCNKLKQLTTPYSCRV